MSPLGDLSLLGDRIYKYKRFAYSVVSIPTVRIKQESET